MVSLDKINSLSELKQNFGSKLPNHVGLILDGNRRWIKKKGLINTLKGHEEGYKTLRKILFPFFEAGIKYLSLYALSSENILKRSEKELQYLFNLLLKGVKDVLDEPLIHEKKVHVKVIGRIEELPQNIQIAIKEVNCATEQYHGSFINICINYDGQLEIIDAVKKIIDSKISSDLISKKVLKSNLYTKDFPEADYIIRTGMEDGLRISGFLLWDASYSEFRFRSELWPDYNQQMLLDDLKEFIIRKRRKGK